MIDWNATAKLNKSTVEYLKSWFKKYPGSSKRIIRICDICNGIKEICFQNHSDLCHKCAHNTSEYLELASTYRTLQYATQEYRNGQRDRLLQYHIDNPESGKAHSKRLIQWYKDHPEAKEAARLRSLEQMSDLAMRTLLSKSAKQTYIDNPTMFDENNKMMRGGHDIVGHHFIYDHNNPDQHITEITRSQHSAHHAWMRRNGLEVPHLNVTEKNKNIFKGRKL